MARPSEIKAVVDILTQPADDVRDVARNVIDAIDQAREERVDYVVVAQVRTYAQAYGPYVTEKQAATAIEKGQIRAIDGARLFVFPLHHPKAHARRADAADVTAISPEAVKLWEIARNGGQVARTHSRRKRRTA